MTLKATWSRTTSQKERGENKSFHFSPSGENSVQCAGGLLWERASNWGLLWQVWEHGQGQAHTNGCPLVHCMLGDGDARPGQEKNERNLWLKIHLPRYSLFRSQHSFLFYFKIHIRKNLNNCEFFISKTLQLFKLFFFLFWHFRLYFSSTKETYRKHAEEGEENAMQQRCPATFKPQALLLHTTYMYFCIYASLTTNPPGFSNYPTATCCAVHGT